jgi:hypothetical protein
MFQLLFLVAPLTKRLAVAAVAILVQAAEVQLVATADQTPPTAQRQARTRQAAAAVQVEAAQTAATAVRELFMSGLRFSHGTFCKSRKQ